VIEQINRRIGYRLQLREISWPREIAVASPFSVHSLWANVGVAPCYPGGFMALTLKDEKQGIASVLTEEGFNLRELKPGLPGQAPARRVSSEFVVGRVAPVIRPGEYSVYVSAGMRDGTPQLALPLAEGDGYLRYRLGQIRVRE